MSARRESESGLAGAGPLDGDRPATGDRTPPGAPETNAEALAARRKNARGLRTRQRLVEAAADCFAEYGYGQTRVSDIVFRAGVSQGNFYRHFASKKDVFIEALKPGMDELLASSSRAGLGSTHDLPGLIELTTAYLSTYSRNRQLLRTMREAAAAHAEDGLVDMWLAQRALFVQRTRRWLDRLFAQGLIGDGDRELLAEALGSAVEQMAYVHIGLAAQTPRPERLRAIAEVLAEVWYRALPPTEPTP